MIDWIASAGYGALSGHAETAVRALYGALLFVQLLYTWPNARRFYATTAFGGYMESTPRNDRLHTPATSTAVMLIWVACALSLATGVWVLGGALINFCLARYFFLSTRWRSILRGMGAPGHMNHWLAALALLLVFSERFDLHGLLHSLTVVTFRVDFAAIMIAAGIYKIVAGYGRGEGFELGLVNPWWGHYPAAGRRFPADSIVFAAMNRLAYGTEILCGAAFFVPAVAPFAGIVLAASFLGVGRMIRLTALAEMVAICALLYVFPGDAVDKVLAFVPSAPMAGLAPSWAMVLIAALAIMLGLYLIVLPFAYAGMAVNLYAKRRLSPWLQRPLDVFTRFFGLVLWRVFTTDVINFYTEISVERAGSRFPIDIPGPLLGRWGLRYRHVGEFITLASVFTTLKYYPNDRALFERRILAYARSLQEDGLVTFKYVIVVKRERRFAFLPVAQFVVDPAAGTVAESVLDPGFDVRRPADGSPVTPGTLPGSYAPAL
jgi:hypothetical protein